MKITAKNFQSIKEAQIEIPDKSFVCIVGPSDIGKSSIFRAVDGVMTNCPISGEIRKGQKNVEVEIEEDGLTVKWEKGLTKHQYTVVKDGETPVVLEKTGGNVPEEVRKFGFDTVKTQATEYNLVLRGQHDPIFLNNDARGAADLVSKLGQLDRLSRAVDLCSVDIKRDKKDLGSLNESRLELERSFEKFAFVPDLQIKVNEVEKKVQELGELEEKIAWIEKTIEIKKRIESRNSRLKQVDFSKLPKSIKIVSKIEEINRLTKIVEDTIKKKASISKSIEVSKKKVDFLSVIPERKIATVERIKQAFENMFGLSERKSIVVSRVSILAKKNDLLRRVKNVSEKYSKLEELSKRLNSISEVRSRFVISKGNVNQLGQAVETVSEQIKQVKLKLAEVKTCPLCGAAFEVR